MQFLKSRLAMIVEDDVRVFDIQHMAREDAVARLQNAASLQIRDRSFEGFFDIGLSIGMDA